MIKTNHLFPPIPDRQFDWCAYHDGDEETGHVGFGRSKQEAIEDLQRLDQERAEATCEHDRHGEPGEYCPLCGLKGWDE